MGIIIRQSIKGSIWSYLGVIIGFFTTAYLYPKYLDTEVVGLFGILVAWSALFTQLSSLGFNGVTARLFPYFRDKEHGHNGFLFIALVIMICGFILFLLTFYFLRPWLISSNIEKSQLFTEYINLIIPLTFFTLIFSFLDIFNKLLYDAVFGTFLMEFLQRLFILIIIVFFAFGLFSLHTLVLAYAGSVCAKGIIIFFYLLFKGEINLRPNFQFIDKRLKREMINVAIYSILAGIGGNIVFQIDKIIVNQMLGLSATGIYTIAFYFGTLVVIPSRPLLRISGTLIADAWKRDDKNYIAEIYQKSCLNQFLIAVFLFGGLWINIDNILTILGPDYTSGKWVIFFIGLGYLIDMATGANGQIISYSKYYRMSLLFLAILIVLVFSTMHLLIPLWGIEGAAAAIAISFFANNLMRYIFLYKKFKFQPFSYKFLLVIFAFICAYTIGYYVPRFNLLPDIIIRGGIFTIIYLSIILGFRLSPEVNDTTKTILMHLKLLLFPQKNKK